MSIGPTVSAIYVSWRDTDVLVRSLRRLREVAGDDEALEVVVVVNEATDDATPAVESAWPGATVIANEDNRGFGPACNQGAEAASGDILLFLNPDTLAEDGAVEQIRRAFVKHSRAIAVAPRLLDEGPAEEDQRLFQLRRLPTLGADARELLLFDRAVPGNRCRRWSRYLDEDRDRPFEVEQAAAAALAVRREVFKAVAGFDERFRPAYWEDVDLCLRLRRHGPILFWPAARLAHVGGIAASALGRRRFRRVYYRNALRYRDKHYAGPAALAYRLLLTVGMAMRATITLLASRRGTETSQELRGFLDVAGMAVRSTTWPRR
ncbi:MAG: glycosyltransferase family 2 protein [Chloroflexota bacterium]|jgi:hypothetical protein